MYPTTMYSNCSEFEKSRVERKKRNKRSSIEEIKVTLEKKKQCNSKALEIVTRFSEKTMDEDSLLGNIKFINQEHYQDIIEERAINKLCGYPLCSSKLSIIPSKQYHISTIHNKVFDISDRKNFCSNLCYKASKYLKDQISTSPLWHRESDASPIYKLISLQSKGGIVGDEVNLGCISMKLDEDNVLSNGVLPHFDELNKGAELSSSNNEMNNTESTLSYPINSVNNCGTINNECENSFSNDAVLHESSEMPKVAINLNEKSNISSDNTNLVHSSNPLLTHSDINISSSNEENCSMITKNLVGSVTLNPTKTYDDIVMSQKPNVNKNYLKNKSSKNNAQSHIDGMQNVIIKVEHVLKEWISIDTLCFIFGEEKVKEMFSEKTLKNKFKYSADATMDVQCYDKYLAICRKLNILELEETKLDASFREEVKRPLPDFEVLKEEAKQMDLKVKMFYKGDKVVQFEEPQENSEIDEPILPLVDLHAQKILRRRIVIDRLRRVLQDVQCSLDLKSFNLIEEVRILINTFILSAHNIVLKPTEWNLIAIVVIKLLTFREKLLEEAFHSEPTSKHLTLLLMSYSLDRGYLDRLIVWLTDIDYIIRKNC